jgi:hypothetical protein
VITAEFIKVTGDPAWTDDPEMLAFMSFIKAYAPDLDPNDKLTIFGYYNAAMVVALIRQCGDNLTRENILEQATHLKNVEVPMLLPGITLNTTPEDYSAIKQMQRFDVTGWSKIGGIVAGKSLPGGNRFRARHGSQTHRVRPHPSLQDPAWSWHGLFTSDDRPRPGTFASGEAVVALPEPMHETLNRHVCAPMAPVRQGGVIRVAVARLAARRPEVTVYRSKCADIATGGNHHGPRSPHRQQGSSAGAAPRYRRRHHR